MLKTTAIAYSFHEEVVKYIEKRGRIENKKVILLKYSIDSNKEFKLEQIYP